jgi:small subunit ribosomal protein S8
MVDPVADMLTRLRNGGAAQKLSVSLPHSNQLERIAKTLAEAEYIDGFSIEKLEGAQDQLVIEPAYHDDSTPQIEHLKRLSRPARRSYIGVAEIPTVRNGHGDVVLSTPAGVLTGDKARQQHVGGEILFEIW